MHRNRHKESGKKRIQEPDSFKHESSKREEIKPKMQERRGEDEYSAHIDELNKISFISFRGIHLYKARAIRPSSYPLKLRD